MRDLRSIHALLLLALLAGCGATPSSSSTATSTPEGLTESGTFTIREGQVLRAAVGHAGEGTLIFHGWQYPFTFENMKVGAVGSESVELEGTVYNMAQVEDFEGTYTLTKAEIKAGEGLSGVWGKNEKGVVAHLRAKGQDLEIDLQATGAKFTLK